MRMLKKLIKQLPFYKRLEKYKTEWEPGHFYSAIPNQASAIESAKKVYGKIIKINGIDLNDKNQLALFNILAEYFKDFIFNNKDKVSSHRFYQNNGYYGGSDALYLYSMIRYLKPKRIIEAGSGFTSALMMDRNSLHFNEDIDLTFIEPYPERLLNLLTENDKKVIKLKEQQLQTVDLNLFRQFDANDILLIDSSHVAKTGSDLLYLFFDIFPVLKPGVYIHFHDIFNNFEYYPGHFERKGFGWNEGYFLRTFLMNNPCYEVILFSNYLDTKYKDKLLDVYPDFPLFTGAQFWMKKMQD